MMNTVVISCAIVLVLCALKVVNMVWLRPKKLEKLLKQQGFKGNNYRFLFGDMKQLDSMFREARSKPMNLDDEDGTLLPRVVPFPNLCLKRYGKNFIVWLGWTPRVEITDPELIKEIFLKWKEFQKPRSNPFINLLVTGLVSYEGDQWAKHRKLLNPAFRMEKLKGMLPAFDLSCSEMIRKWEKVVSSHEACELDVWPHLQALTSDALSRTAFGSNYEQGIRIFELILEQGEHVIQASQSIYIPGSRYLPTKRNRKMVAIDNEIQASVRVIIEKRLKDMKSGEANNNDLLGMLLDSNMKEIEEHGNKSYGMTTKEVIEECKLFYFAGQETTSSLLVWTMIMLSKHQEWQSRAREEVLKVFGNKSAFDADGLNHLKVVTMIFHEVLRLYPPVVGLQRQVYKDMTLGELSLSAGIQVGLPILLLHYDKEIWGEDVKEFKPERFSEGVSKATNNRLVYFPFGGGPRICIGQNFAMLEAKLALAKILLNFSFELSPSYLHAPHTVVTLQPQFGAHLMMHKL